MLSTKVRVVGVTSRSIRKEGQELRFYDLNYSEGYRVGTLAIPEKFVGRLRDLSGQDVELQLEAEQDRRAPWLYRLELVDVLPVLAEARPAAVAGGAK